MADYKRHDLSDEPWIKLEPLLIGKASDWGAVAKDNRQFINAVLWILRSGTPWRDVPQVMADGKIHIVFFVADMIKIFGKGFWKN